MESRNQNCAACRRYADQPLWGHDMCTTHRLCCTNPGHWEPNKCDTCLFQRDIMELMSENEQIKNLEDMDKMLLRTQHGKSIMNPRSMWQYVSVATEFMSGVRYSDQSNRFTPSRETTFNTNNPSYTPRLGCGFDNQSSYTPNSVVGDVSRTYVNLALNSHTRNSIENEIQRENSRLHHQMPYSNDSRGTAYHAYPSNPEFRFHQPNGSQQASHYTVDQGGQVYHTEACHNVAGPSNNLGSQKRARSPVRERHSHKKRNHKRRRRDDSESSSSSSNSSSSDTDDSDLEEGEISEKRERDTVFDPYDLQPWIAYDHRIHEKLNDNKMILPSSSGQRVTAEVIYNPLNPHVFRTKPVLDDNRVTPYLNASEAHNMIMRSFNLRASDAISPNKLLKIVDSRIAPNSGLGRLMDLIKGHETQMTKITRDKSEKQLMQAFPEAAFDSITVVNLKGWPFPECDYIEWAKDKPLSLDEFKEFIRHPNFDTSSCTEQLLSKEREYRKLLANQLQSLHLVELYSLKVGNLDDNTKAQHRLSSEEGTAVLQTMQPITKFLQAQWMHSKMDIRNALLSKNSWIGNVSWILQSSLWNSSIFPKSAIDHLRYEVTNDVAEKLGLLRQSTNKFTGQQAYKKMKFQKTSIADRLGPPQTQQNRKNKQNFLGQKFREGKKTKKSYQLKTNKWTKTNKANNKKFKDTKDKQNGTKNQYKNAKGNSNKYKQEQ